MLTLILLTSITQILPESDQGFNLTLPEEFTTTTPEPIDFTDDSSGDSLPIPKGKKGKHFKKSSPPKKSKVNNTLSNQSMALQSDSSSNKSFILLGAAGGILAVVGLGNIIYNRRKRTSGYDIIKNNQVNYGSTW